MSNKKVIFLDVDGVLNDDMTEADAPSGCIGIALDKVLKLKCVVDDTNAAIVLSSSWKAEFPAEGVTTEDGMYLVKCLDHYGIELEDITVPGNATAYRGGEIRNWLDRHPEVSHWVVLDDEVFCDFSERDIMPYLVKTDGRKGLTPDDVKLAIEILT